jgi:hypothetical protein
MGKVIGRKCKIILPDNYWESSCNNIEWIYKEINAKTVKRNK